MPCDLPASPLCTPTRYLLFPSARDWNWTVAKGRDLPLKDLVRCFHTSSRPCGISAHLRFTRSALPSPPRSGSAWRPSAGGSREEGSMHGWEIVSARGFLSERSLGHIC